MRIHLTKLLKRCIPRLFVAIWVSISLFSTSCAFRSIRRTKGIVYQQGSAGKPPLHLNVFRPRSKKQILPVLVFVHGGSWRSGNKDIYNFLGRRLARKRVVAVTIDYPLSPAQIPEMAMSTARAIAWVKNNIGLYGGDSTRIYLSGHSAGGHLAALVGTDTSYFNKLGLANPIKGIVLIDAAGLNMYAYLTEQVAKGNREFLDVFSSNLDLWKKATPLYYLSPKTPPFLIFRGGNTYQSLVGSNDTFALAVRRLQPQTTYKILPRKRHVGMITQFLNSYNARYSDILRFMGQ